MPNITFASNNLSHWPNAVAGSVADTYDANRVPYSIAMSNFEILNSPVFAAVAGDETWFHARIFPGNFGFGNEEMLIQAYQPDGTVLFNLKKIQNQYEAKFDVELYDGSSTNQQNSTVNFTAGKLGFWDIRYKVTGLLIELDFFVNGALAASLAFASNPNGYENPVSFSLGCPFTDSLGDIQHYSEIIVADGDTRNARLDLLRPVAAGAYEEWIGSLVALADDDPTSGMTTIAAAKRQTVSLSAYSGAANISNFVIVSQTTRGQNSPTKIKHTIRLSTVDYDSADIPCAFALQYNLTDYLINPATSLPWVGSDLSAIETGFMSVA